MSTVVISGASSGIGAATALRFAREGFDLLLIGRNLENLKKTKSECQVANLKQKLNIELLPMDLKQFSNVLVSEKLKGLLAPEILINNAGVYNQNSFSETDDDIWMDQFQTNLMGSVKLTRQLWPLFTQQNQGSIVNVASTLGIKPVLNTSAYSAMKAAMINWTLSLAIEGGAANIRANCICPGIIDTPIHPFHTESPEKKMAIENNISKLQLLKKFGKPEDIAESIYFLATKSSQFTTGSILSVDGGINIK